MAFPSIVNSATTNGTTAATSLVINLPANIKAGNTLLVLLRAAVTGTGFSFPAGWTELFDNDADASDDRTAWAWRKADGTEGATITVTTSASAKFAAIAHQISGATDPTIRAPEFAALVTGTSATPDPGTVTPTGGAKDYLFLWGGGWEGEQTSPPASLPTNYGNALGAMSGTAGAITTNVRVASADFAVNAASENPGSWTISVSDDWTATVVALHPAEPIAMPLGGTPIGHEPNPRAPARADATLRTWALNLLQSTLAPLEALPFALTDWPLPIRHPQSARATERLTWIQSLNQITQATAAIFRAPLVARVLRPEWLRAVTAQLALNLLTTTLAVSLAAPFAPAEWPNPGRTEYPRALRTFLDPLKLPLLGQDQFFAAAGMGPTYDWPTPRGPAGASELRTWLVNLQQSTLEIVAATPFAPLDWPLPGRPEWPRALRTFLANVRLQLIGQDAFFGLAGQPTFEWPVPRGAVGFDLRIWPTPNRLPLTTVVLAPPFSLTDWPNPNGPKYPIGLRTWFAALLQSTLRGQDQFFGLAGHPTFEWPVPRGPVRGIDLRTWVLNLLETTLSPVVVPAPFAQTDWPLPRGATPAIGLRTWLDALKLTLLGKDQFFGLAGHPTVDWPNPRGPLGAIGLRTWVQSAQPTVQAPFVLLDWPNPRGREFSRGLRTFLNALEIPLIGQDTFFGGPGQPPPNRDWPNPRGAQRASELRTWVLTLSTTTLNPLAPFGPSRVLIVPGIATAFLVPLTEADYIVLSQTADFMVPENDEDL